MALTNKRHLFLTGTRGAGKTTLLNALAEPDLVTRAVPGVRVELSHCRSGKTVPIGVFDPTLPGRENRMAPILGNLQGEALQMLNACRENGRPWAVMDEIGYLEAACPEYCRALAQLMEEKPLLAAVRKQDIPFLQDLLHREDACVVDLDEPFGSLGCVIMASGRGTRFGGNKLMADFRGEPMIQRILDAAGGIFTKRVVVTRHRDVAELCREQGVPVVLHELPHRSDTVRLGLEALGEELEGCVFCPADQPLLTRESLEVLALSRDSKISRLSWQGRGGTPVLFPKWCFPQLKALPEGKGGSVLLKKYSGQVQNVPARGEWELRDADTPEELEELEKNAREIH